MSEGKYVIKVMARLISSRLIYRVFVGIAVIFISNYLISDPKLADTFSVAQSVTSMLMIGSEIGMSMVLMRAAAHYGEAALQKYYGTALTIETGAWLGLFVLVLGGYALVNGFTTLFWLMAILAVNQAVIQYRVPVRSIFRSLHQAERITYLEVLDGISKLVSILLITKFIDDRLVGAYAIAGLVTVTTIIFIAVYSWFSFRLVKPRLETNLMKPMFSEGIWYSLQGVIMTVYFEIDKVMLRILQNTGLVDIAPGDIARYTAASQIIVFLLIFHRIGLQVITPYLYGNYPNNLERYRRIVRLATRYLGAFGMGLGVGIFVLADDIMQLIYKEALWAAAPVLRFFGIFLIIRFIGITSSQIFATTGNQPKRTKQEGLGVVLNIVLDIILIPFFGFMGCAIATLVTETVTQSVFYVMTRRLIQDSLWLTIKKILPAAVAGVGMGLLIFWLKPFTTIWLLIPLGALFYGALLWLFRFFNASDRALIRSGR